MATGTLSPDPRLTFLDTNGNPLVAGKVTTYLAGTTTPVATYTDVGLTIANANPIILDSAGRAVVFLTPGASYKYLVQDSSGATIYTQDNIASVPSSAASVDVTGTAGESITAGQAVYLSDGSGGKVAGQWYKADSGQTYSSILPEVGIAPSAIVSGASGTIRLVGSVPGLTSLSVGSSYYVGSAGAITTSAPVAKRFLGVADSTTSLILQPPPAPVQPWVNDFRLTLTSGTPVTVTDVTAATTLYAALYSGNRIDLPDSNGNPIRLTSAEFSIAIPATTSQMYDVFAYANGSVAALELLAWTNDTTRATAIVRTNGRWMKSGDSTRLYLGSVRTTGVSGQTEDSVTKRYLWNNYNTKRRKMLRFESTASWTYTTNSVRQANGAAANQLDFVTGVSENPVEAFLQVVAGNTSAIAVAARIGLDSATMANADCVGGEANIPAGGSVAITARYLGFPGVGRHTLVWSEQSTATGTTTWYANSLPYGVGEQSGLLGTIEG